MGEQIAIYGAGGFAREVAWLVESCNELGLKYEITCFIDDAPSLQGSVFNQIPVLSFDEFASRYEQAKVICAIGNPKTRQNVMERVANFGYKTTFIVHPRTEMSKWVNIGEGTLICAGNILTTNILIGKNVHINLDCTIGHDVILGDYTTLAPGVHVSGWVHFGKRVYVGTGAVIINGTKDNPLIIGDDVVIGAGACVTKSVEFGATVVGIPAKPLKR